MNQKTIISVSRRTDIPAHYMDWFARRLKSGYALARNPLNKNQSRQVSLLPEDVSCLVFWSKDPTPLLSRLDILTPYAYYLHNTVNAYGSGLEPGLPPLAKRLDTFRRLADALGAERMLWRYDPILYSPEHGADFHAESFAHIAGTLRGYTQRITVSFLDMYAKIEKPARALSLRRPHDSEARLLLPMLAAIARQNGLSIQACAEADDYASLGVSRARCIDPLLIARITGKPVSLTKDKNQRPACGCAPSVDIGAYHTCPHGCVYCYANSSLRRALDSYAQHDPNTPSL